MDDLPTANRSYRYWAFISYSHSDEKWAKWIQRRIEKYRVPKSIVELNDQSGQVVDRLRPVFRDRTDLPAAGHLPDAIKGSLRQSRCLIVVCSPRSARSGHVASEIEDFRKLNPDGLILSAIIEGNPADESGPAVFPPALLTAPPSAAERQGSVEPLAADLQPGKDGKSRGVLKLIAGMLGVKFDKLWQRERKRRIRRMLIVAIAIAAVALAIWTIWNKYQSELEAHSERILNSAILAEDSAAKALLVLEIHASNLPVPEGAADFLRDVLAAPVPLAVLHGHSGIVRDVAFNTDGTVVASASSDGTVRLWSADGIGAVTILSHDDDVYGVDFSPSGELVASASQDGSAKIWRASDGQVVSEIQLGSEGNSVDFDSTGELLAIGTDRGGVRVWDVANALEINTLGSDGDFRTVEFGPNDQMILAADIDPAVRGPKVWLLPVDGQEDPVSLGEFTTVRSASFDATGDRIFVTVWKSVRVIDRHSGERLTRIGESGVVWEVTLVEDSDRLVTASMAAGASIWKLDSDESPVRLLHRENVRTVSVSPNGNLIVTGSDDGIVRVWLMPSPSVNLAELTWNELVGRLAASTTACLSIEERQEYLSESVLDARIALERCQSERHRSLNLD